MSLFTAEAGLESVCRTEARGIGNGVHGHVAGWDSW